MGNILPSDQWRVRINKDGKAEVCISELNGHLYWYFGEWCSG